MHSVLNDLMHRLGLNPGSAPRNGADEDEIWLRANQRFDICAGWVHEEHCLQLHAVVRASADGALVEPAADDDLDEWDCEFGTRDAWHYRVVQHIPSSFVALIARAEGHTLDSASLPDFVSSFIERLQLLDERFNGEADQPSNGAHFSINKQG